MRQLISIIAILCFPILICNAQELDKGKSTITVSGTSTLHDWTIKAEEFESSASIQIADDKVHIDHLSMIIKVEALKSGKRAMDDNTYKAMNSKKYPEIKYEFKEVKSIENTTNGYLLNTIGTLVIAGVSRECEMEVAAETSEIINFAGAVSFKMSDFEIAPPKALLGTIKTGDEVEINFNVFYK